jgi:hypothetical protein
MRVLFHNIYVHIMQTYLTGIKDLIEFFEVLINHVTRYT